MTLAVWHTPDHAIRAGDGRHKQGLEMPLRMPDHTPLLATKIALPPVRTPFVPRPRLHARLAAGLRAKLILVAAPAGWGKSSSVAGWLHAAQLETRAAWVALDAGDNDPQRFWSYVVAALRPIQPDLDAAVLPLLQTPQIPVEAVLTALLNALAGLETDVVLVLDDYHVVDTPAIHEALQFLVDHLPPRLHLLVASRADPPLALARLRVRGELVELRVADLRFTAEEAALFLRETMGLELTPEQVGVLEARTEGWIAGLQLAALAMRDRSDVAGFIRAFTGSNRFVLDYLAEEVLASLPAHLHSFVLQTAILDQLSDGLCDAVILGSAPTRDAYSQVILDELERLNLFLIPLDDERRWYRYHHLFADVVRERLRRGTPPDRIALLHGRASMWYEQQGSMPEAIHHALAGHDWERAVELIEGYVDPAFKRSEEQTLLGFIDRLPAGARRGRPCLHLACATAMVVAHQFDAAEQAVRAAEQALLAAPPDVARNKDALLAEIAAVRAGIAIFQWQVSDAIAFAHEALAGLAAEKGYVRPVVTRYLGLAYYRAGDVRQANHWYLEAVRVAEEVGDIVTAVFAIANHAEVVFDYGQLHQAAATLQQAIDLAAQSGLQHTPITSLARLILAECLYEWNELETAAHQLLEAIEHNKHAVYPRLLVNCHVALAQVSRRQGDLRGLWDHLDAAERLTRRHHLPVQARSRVTQLRVQLSLEHDDLGAASEWARTSGLQGESGPGLARSPLSRLFARVLIAQGELECALALLARIYDAEAEANRWSRVIQTLTLQAVALRAQGKTECALQALERALALAEPEGYIRTFVDEGAPMQTLLLTARARGTYAPYVDRLLAAFPESMKPAAHTPRPPSVIGRSLVEPLSERELEVLRLLATGLSNHAIADKLIVGHNTVKKHLSNIYAKLGVQSRTEALARARELHLL